MKKRMRKRLLILTACISAGAAVVAAEGGEDCFCVLTERSGFVAVVRAGEPDALTDIAGCHLPEEDRKMLRAGIRVEDQRQLLQLLEDLGS